MNWLLILGGFVVGASIGICIGILVAEMCVAAHNGDLYLRSYD